MKQLLYCLICITQIFFMSCNESVLNTNEPDNKISPHSQVIKTMDEAISIAIDAAERLYPTKSRGASRSALKTNVKSITNPFSRAGQNDTLLYVVNFDNEKGYAIIPATYIDKKVLAVIEKGSYDPEKGSNNPGLNYFMDAAINYTANAPVNPLGYGDIIIVKPGDLHPAFDLRYDTITHLQIKPRLDGVEWGQTGIYSVYCPEVAPKKRYTGCIPTAIASIVTYVNKITKHNSSFTFTFPKNTFGTQRINWDELFLHKCQFAVYNRPDGTKAEQNQLCLESFSYNTHNLIAALMRQIGYDGDADYKETSTSVNSSKCKPLLGKYLPDHNITNFKDFDFESAKTSLLRCILLMAGGNHAWVADGYNQLDYRKYYAEWDFTKKEWNVLENRIYYEHFIHFCWGWTV